MDDDNIRSLGAIRAEKTGDNRLWTPVECLEEAIRDIKAGKLKVDSLCIIFLDTEQGESFNLKHYSANARASVMLSMLECSKINLFKDMGYLDQ
jgi:hypothetical protein